MYRVIAIIGGALALAACSSTSDWMDSLKPGPAMDTVRFESEPPGAEAKTSNGQTCRTPCALALPVSGPLTVTFTLAGHQPETEALEVIENTGSPPTFRPNPVVVELSVAPPQGKPGRKPAAKKPAAKKPATKKPAAAAAPAAPAPTQAAPAQQGSSPWPSTTRQ